MRNFFSTTLCIALFSLCAIAEPTQEKHVNIFSENHKNLDSKIGFEIPPSKERAALMVLFIENPQLINETIIRGLRAGDRLKVYNEIKTGLNPTNDPKIQVKRDEIAELFGKED